MGKGIQTMEIVMEAMRMAGEAGLGKERQSFGLTSVQDRLVQEEGSLWEEEKGMITEPVVGILELPEKPKMNYSSHPASITIETQSSIRLLERKKLLTTPSFLSFIKAIFRRADLIYKAHFDQPLQLPYAEWLALAEKIELVGWESKSSGIRRYSNRQQKHIHLQGITGTLTYSGKELEAFIPYLHLGEVIHVGKGASMGGGRFLWEIR